jgi:hypothetical protein
MSCCKPGRPSNQRTSYVKPTCSAPYGGAWSAVMRSMPRTPLRLTIASMRPFRWRSGPWGYLANPLLELPSPNCDPTVSCGFRMTRRCHQATSFSTDLFRDFTLCRLFIAEGWDSLSSAGAPRWSIRATRLGCQAALLARETSTAWAVLSTQFAEIAQRHGERWLEVPFEALLTLGDAERAIRDVWDTLIADEGSSLAALLRLAEARYVRWHRWGRLRAGPIGQGCLLRQTHGHPRPPIRPPDSPRGNSRCRLGLAPRNGNLSATAGPAAPAGPRHHPDGRSAALRRLLDRSPRHAGSGPR